MAQAERMQHLGIDRRLPVQVRAKRPAKRRARFVDQARKPRNAVELLVPSARRLATQIPNLHVAPVRYGGLRLPES